MKYKPWAMILTFIVFMPLPSSIIAQVVDCPDSQEEIEAVEELRNSYFDIERELSHFLVDFQDDGKVTKITLDRFNESVAFTEDPVINAQIARMHKDKQFLSASTEDPTYLTIVQKACSTRWLMRRHAPPGSGLGAMGGYILGRLKIHTTESVLTIYITQIGFKFGDGPSLGQRLFYSWALAKVVDDLVADATKNQKHLSRQLFFGLSGEGVIEMNKRIYWMNRNFEAEKRWREAMEEERKEKEKEACEKEGRESNNVSVPRTPRPIQKGYQPKTPINEA